MVDDQINRVQRVDLLCVAAKGHQRVTHRGQINNSWNAGEILQQYAGRAVRNLARVLATLGTPLCKRFDVVDGDRLAIFKAQHVFQNHFQRGRQLGEITKASGRRGRDRVIINRLIANCQRLARLGGVVSNCNGHVGSSFGVELREWLWVRFAL